MKDVLRTSKVLKLYKVRRKELGKKISEVDLLLSPHIKEWDYWVLIKNKFPYDKIAKQHDLLLPARKIIEMDELEDIELNELFDIKIELAKE